MNQKNNLFAKKHVASVIVAGLMFSAPTLAIAVHPETALAETPQDKQIMSANKSNDVTSSKPTNTLKDKKQPEIVNHIIVNKDNAGDKSQSVLGEKDNNTIGERLTKEDKQDAVTANEKSDKTDAVTALSNSTDETKSDDIKIMPSGTKLLPNGDVIKPDGVVIHKDGSKELSDGTKVIPGEGVIQSDGVKIEHNSHISGTGTGFTTSSDDLGYVFEENKNGNKSIPYGLGVEILNNGDIVRNDKYIVHTDGIVTDKNGHKVTPKLGDNGDKLFPYGIVVRKNGNIDMGTSDYAYSNVTIKPNGDITVHGVTNGTPAIQDDITVNMNDGSIVLNDGTRVKSDGVVVKPNGDMIDNQGNTISSDGKYIEQISPNIQFKDENLKKALLDDMKKQKLISETATEITKDDALKLTTFNSSVFIYSSFEGIQNFKNLTSFYASHVGVSDFKPLASLTKLTSLYLAWNDVPDIKPLANLTNLTDLNLAKNQISDLTPLKGLTKLETLVLSDNNISDITPLKSLTNLTNLRLDENNISDVTPLKDLAKLGQSLLDGQLIDLQPTTTTVDLKKIIKGVDNIIFDKDDNIVDGVLTYKEGMENPYQVSVNGKLGENDYSATINVDFSKAMNPVVQFKDPKLKERILSEMKNQKLIDQDEQDITEKDALKVTNLSIASGESAISSLRGIEKFKNLTTLDLSGHQLSDITQLKDLNNLTNLNLGDNQISDITSLKNLNNLTELQLHNNKITDISSIKDLTKLTYLVLDFNGEISNITSLKNLTNLTYLGLGENKISDITSLKNLNKLTEIHLNGNQISDVTPLKDLTNLKNLWLTKNQIQNLECLNGLKSEIDATDQAITVYPTTTTVDLKKEIKGFGNVTFDSDDNTSDGVLTYKIGMENPYSVDAFGNDKNHKYQIDINVDFSKAKLDSEIQAADISKELQKLLDEDSTVKATDNYKNADDNLKQAYDKTITDGKAIYDKLSSTPEQVKQATENIKTALDALNGDAKSNATLSQLQSQLDAANGKIQTLSGELEKAKQQGTADKATIQSLTEQLQQAKNALEKLKSDKTLSDQQKQAEIDKLNGQIKELEKQVKELSTCPCPSKQPDGKAIVAPLVDEKPEFDLEKYKKEYPSNSSTPVVSNNQTDTTVENKPVVNNKENPGQILQGTKVENSKDKTHFVVIDNNDKTDKKVSTTVSSVKDQHALPKTSDPTAPLGLFSLVTTALGLLGFKKRR